jgi:hypothetical protein
MQEVFDPAIGPRLSSANPATETGAPSMTQSHRGRGGKARTLTLRHTRSLRSGDRPMSFLRKSSHRNGCPIHDAVSSRHGWESTNAHAPACKKSSIRRSAHVFPPQIQHRNGCPGACPERSRRVSPLRPGKARLQRPVNTRLHANVPNPHIRISKVHVPVLQIIIPFPRTMEPCPDLRKQER